MTDLITCPRCKLSLPPEKFHKCKTRANGRDSYCKKMSSAPEQAPATA